MRHRLLGIRFQRFALFERYVRWACEVDVRVWNGERARLVDDDRPNLMQVLQRRRVLYENLLLRSLADAHHERRRRSQSHCAGAGYDEHSHSRENSVRQCGVASYSPPHAEREQSDGSHRRHEHPCGSVYDALHGRLAALRLLHHAYDVRKSCVLANLTRTHTQLALTGYGSGEHGVACFLHSRCRFAAYHRLVYISRIGSHETLSRTHHAVHRNLLSGAHLYRVAYLNRRDRHLLHAVVVSAFHLLVRHDARRLGLHTHELAYAARRAVFRFLLKTPTGEHERDYHHRSVEVGVPLYAACAPNRLAEERIERAEEERYERAQRHERVHVRRAMRYLFCRRHIEASAAVEHV